MPTVTSVFNVDVEPLPSELAGDLNGVTILDTNCLAYPNPFFVPVAILTRVEGPVAELTAS